jgi:hypothetical protein
MAVLTLLVATSIGIMASSFVWAWRFGSPHETIQERHDLEFERIADRIRQAG